MSDRLSSSRCLFPSRKNEVMKERTVITTKEINLLLSKSFNTGEKNLWNSKEIITYLNELCAAVVLVNEFPSIMDNFYSTICKKVGKFLLSDRSSIRTLTYRILRKASRSVDDLSILIHMHVDIFVIRSLELEKNNLEERIEALKLCVLMLTRRNEMRSFDSESIRRHDSSLFFPVNVYRTILAIADGFLSMQLEKAKVEKNELAFTCFAILIEQIVVDPDIVLNSISIGWIVELLTYAAISDRLCSLICRVLCTWLDSPQLRSRAELRLVLDRIFAPIVEIGLFERKEALDVKQQSLSTNAPRLGNFSQIFLNLLRTWSGLLACSALSDRKTSTLKFFNYIGLNRSTHATNHNINDLVIQNCCELLELPYSKITFTNWHHAMEFYSTMHHPDTYKCLLRDDFILAEFKVLLKIDGEQTIANDLLVSYRAAVVYLLINADLIQALSRVILQDPDDSVALKGTLLLRDLLFAGASYLPREWKLRVLSLPTLVHSACEASGKSVTLKNHTMNYSDDELLFTFPGARNAFVLLHRLDVLNNIALMQKTQPLPVTNLQIFVQSNPKASRLRGTELLDIEVMGTDVEVTLNGLLTIVVDSDGNICWSVADKLFHFLQNDCVFEGLPVRYYEKCFEVIKMVFSFITPTSGSLTKFDGDHFIIMCCCRAVRVSLLFAKRDAQYEELISNFINDFVINASTDQLLNGPLSIKYLLNTGAMYYFAFLGTMSANKEGRKLLNTSPVLQLLVFFRYS
ncbi:unnamed protein product [Thelazia callipaeda]|uniref:RICTOR_N domain-containing protein n=1 Tax=Thelazia callipaeda TaxID=103827 RepID=A0A0N5D2U0_THECL|nr:unnamed protein product [Thelazia callipaeda]